MCWDCYALTVVKFLSPWMWQTKLNVVDQLM